MTNVEMWFVIGAIGQAVFTARFLVQWAASEREKSSVIPVAFWWLSLVGGTTMLCYAIHRRDPVFTVGQGMGLVVYIRNLMLVKKAARRAAKGHRVAEGKSEGLIPTPHLRTDATHSAPQRQVEV